MYLDGGIRVSGTQMVGSFSDNERDYGFVAGLDIDLGELGFPARLTFDNPTQLTGNYTCTGTTTLESIDWKLINDKQETLTLATPGQKQTEGYPLRGDLNWTD